MQKRKPRSMTRGVVALATALAVTTPLFVVGCAHESAADRQLARLQEDMSRITSDRDGFEKRLSALETERAEPGRPKPAPEAATEVPEARVEPDREHTPVSEDPDDGSPRPSIKVLGAGGSVGSRSGRSRVESDPAPLGDSTGPRPSALDPEARKAYEAALEKARGGRHREGLEMMSAFLAKWPDHPYADNAMYWRAECMAAMGDSQKAIAELESLVSRFPLGNKVPDALAKLSLLYERAGDAAKARAASDKLERDFPKSDAAKRRSRKSSDARPQRPKDIQ
jgi:tol-pal system protein YbgF